MSTQTPALTAGQRHISDAADNLMTALGRVPAGVAHWAVEDARRATTALSRCVAEIRTAPVSALADVSATFGEGDQDGWYAQVHLGPDGDGVLVYPAPADSAVIVEVDGDLPAGVRVYVNDTAVFTTDPQVFTVAGHWDTTDAPVVDAVMDGQAPARPAGAGWVTTVHAATHEEAADRAVAAMDDQREAQLRATR